MSPNEELEMRFEQTINSISGANKAVYAGMNHLAHNQCERAIEELREAIYQLETASLIQKSTADQRKEGQHAAT